MLVPTTYTDICEDELASILELERSIIVDVREDWEFEEFNIGGLNIPLAEIREKKDLLLAYTHIVVVCTNGTRSRVAAGDYCRTRDISEKYIYHLKGGILGVE